MHERNYGLDLLRSMAIIFVLIIHISDSVHSLPQWYQIIAKYGWSGVDIFFVLSGFLIATQVFQEQDDIPVIKSLKNFWIKRWFRTLPLYFLVLFTYLVIKPLAGFPFADNNITPYFFFLQNYYFPTDFVQSWSLCIEEQFYLVFPILIYIFKGKNWPLIAWLAPLLFTFIARYYTYNYFDINSGYLFSSKIRFITHNYLDPLTMGVLLAKTSSVWKKYDAKYSIPIFAIGFTGFIISLAWITPTPSIGLKGYLSPTLLGAFSSVMLIGAYKLRIPNGLKKTLYWCSVTSYGVYLWNPLFMRFFDRYINQFHWTIDIFLFFLVSFSLSFVTYKLVEVPFMNARNRFLYRKLS